MCIFEKQKQTKKTPSLFRVKQNQNKKMQLLKQQNIQRKCAGLTAFVSNCHHKPTVISVCYFMTLNMQVVWNYFCWPRTLTFTILTINTVCWLVKGFIKAYGDGRVFLQNYCSEGAAYRKHIHHPCPSWSHRPLFKKGRLPVLDLLSQLGIRWRNM